MSRRDVRWTDEQVLAILRAPTSQFEAVADGMGMSRGVAAKHRTSTSRRGLRLCQEHGLPGVQWWRSNGGLSPPEYRDRAKAKFVNHPVKTDAL